MGELEELRAKLAAINEKLADKNPACEKCGRKKQDKLDIYFRCAKHHTVFCEHCLTNVVRNADGKVYASEQAHCKEHYLYRQDCYYERI